MLSVYQLYLKQWLQIRWRQWMTTRYLRDWLDRSNHYRMQLLADGVDNPDQRIAEDIQLFVGQTLTIGIGLLTAVVQLGSFVFILWALSAKAPLQLFGLNWTIPGYLVWIALLYAAIGTVFTHWIGRPLIPLNFLHQRYEADFRFNLVRVRENAEQIALSAGETAERQRLADCFGAVIGNWYDIMARQKKLTFFITGFNRISGVLPILIVSPAYFAGAVQMGGLMQTLGAFHSVEHALAFFITFYWQIAHWQAVIARLSAFDDAIAAARTAAASSQKIAIAERVGSPGVGIEELEVRLPSGVALVDADRIEFRPGHHVLVTGPSGAGKSTLFRAIAGIWPFGSGIITLPAGAKAMMLPQRPYLPIGSLAAAVAYPAAVGCFAPAEISEVLVAVGLPALAERLDEEAHWSSRLSPGEQQRLAIARAILHQPDYLFLDEATASLDEAAEGALYRLMQERLTGAIISIGHRSTLAAFHRRQLTLVRDGGRYRIRRDDRAIGTSKARSPSVGDPPRKVGNEECRPRLTPQVRRKRQLVTAITAQGGGSP